MIVPGRLLPADRQWPGINLCWTFEMADCENTGGEAALHQEEIRASNSIRIIRLMRERERDRERSSGT